MDWIILILLVANLLFQFSLKRTKVRIAATRSIAKELMEAGLDEKVATRLAAELRLRNMRR